MANFEQSGPWVPDMYEEYLPEEKAFDEGLIRALLDFYKPLKCLDLGCGLGFYVRYLRDQGVDAWGIEGENLGELFKSPGHQIQMDISQPFDLKERYDLVLCLEVIEHIPREFEDVVFDNILRHMSNYLIFSGATPGQQGTGHVNERHESHWFSHLIRRGLGLRHQESVNIRLSCTLPWYKKNVSVWEFVHPSATDLTRIVARKVSHIISCEMSLHNLRNQLEDFQSDFEQTQSQLEQTQSQLEQTQSQLEQSQSQLIQAQATILAMQASIFWKLKKICFKVIRFFGLMRNG